MKTILTGIFFIAMMFACRPKMAGPVGNDLFDSSYWKLDKYYESGKIADINEAQNFSYMKFDTLDRDRYFAFFDSNRKEISLHTFLRNESFDVNKDRSMGYYINTTKFGLSYKVTVHLDRNIDGEERAYRLEMSNLMTGGYQVEKDTLKYVYIPTEKF